MSKANARELLDGVLFSNRESAEELAAVAQVEATLAVADEIAALREAVDNLRADVRYAGGGDWDESLAPVESEESE